MLMGIDVYQDLRRMHLVVGSLFLAATCTAGSGTASVAGCGVTLMRRDAPGTTATRGPARWARA
jgi:hypothetical protein